MSAATGQSAAHHGLPDRFGRLATDLRVSVTDHCNLRCTYCMPAEGMDWLANRDLLTDDEIIRVIGIGIERLGITKVRFTGGEPCCALVWKTWWPQRRRCAARTVPHRSPR